MRKDQQLALHNILRFSSAGALVACTLCKVGGRSIKRGCLGDAASSLLSQLRKDSSPLNLCERAHLPAAARPDEGAYFSWIEEAWIVPVSCIVHPASTTQERSV